MVTQVRDSTQEPCGRLSFMREPRNYRALTQNAICNLNISLPSYCKVTEVETAPPAGSNRRITSCTVLQHQSLNPYLELIVFMEKG